MRILVTGASGFVGANIVEDLMGRGHEVVALDRPGLNSPLPREIRRSLLSLHVDIRDADACRSAVCDCDVVVHGAAVTPGEGSNLETDRRTIEVNVLGTVNVIQACQDAGAHLIHLGTASVYGPVDEPVLDEERTVPRPLSTYPLSKLLSERLILSRIGAGLAASVLRLGSVFGPYERDTGTRDTISAIHQVTIAAMEARAIILPRSGWRDWIYARDVATAVRGLSEMPRRPTGPINIGQGAEWSVAQWCESLSRHMPIEWRIDAGDANIDFHSTRDRPPLAVERMKNNLGFMPAFDRDSACADYVAWIKNTDETDAAI